MTPRRSLLVLLFALVASTLALGSPGLGAQAGCDEPYPAVYAGRTTVSPNFGFSQVFPAEPVEPPVLSPPVGGDEVSGFFEIGEDATLLYVTDLDPGPFLVPTEIGDLPEDARVAVIEAEGREYLVLSRFESIAGRPVGFLVLWDLDDPCRSLPVVTTTTTTVDATTVPAAPSTTGVATTTRPAPRPSAAPATPIRAAATYTG